MFLIRPPPFSDESLSSWRQRTGMANGFRRYPKLTDKHRLKDPDRLHDQSEMNWLSNELDLAPDNLKALTLDFLAWQATGGTMKTAKHRWILPLGDPSKPSISGPVYCPACLKCDETPYARISWRLAFLSTCPVHGIPLRDRCPSCQTLAWPASVHFINSNSWLTLRYCQKCEQDLTVTDLSTDLYRGTSNQLWDCFTQGSSSAITGNNFSSTDMFNALWALCQLIMRRSSSHIHNLLPSFQFPLDSQRMIQGPTIESTPLVSRRYIIASAAWLLGNWPCRFVDIAVRSNISSSHMLATKAVQPYWMSKIIETHLTLRYRNRITNADVEKAMHHLRSRNEPVTKSAVRRIFDVTENRVIDTYLSQRRKASETELIEITAMFEEALSVSTNKRSQRDSLLRDYLIFMISVLDDKDIATVCLISETEVHRFLTKGLQPTNHLYRAYLRVNELAEIYAIEIRPIFLKSNTCPVWFLSRFGMPLKEHSVRRRLTKMMKSNFSKDLWKSADVFRHMF